MNCVADQKTNQNFSFAESLRKWREKTASVLSEAEFTNSEIEKIFTPVLQVLPSGRSRR